MKRSNSSLKATLATTLMLSFSSFVANAEDLLSVYKAAVENDAQFRAAHAEYKALLETKNQSVSAFLPTISATAYYNQNDDKYPT